MTRYERVFVIGNAEGKVVGLAARHDPAEGEPHMRVVARAGQVVVEVTLPPEVAKLESLVDVHKALGRFRIQDGKLLPGDTASPRKSQ
jgi:hypothetical protein